MESLRILLCAMCASMNLKNFRLCYIVCNYVQLCAIPQLPLAVIASPMTAHDQVRVQPSCAMSFTISV